ncbi:MAG: pyridoxamine 5'-phosphate oxidase family protein [Candidatus Levybacteria bacterium]|nr:pyridoxamine 5'-phosphate oxidase family protein [Candidatus Levybacteria bacterium]
MDLRGHIQDYLSKVQMMQLGTSQSNQPWVTTVYFVSDINLNLYWLSDPEKRHSKEIEKNSKVAGTFVLPQLYGEKVRGLRFEGEARRLTGDENINGVMIYKSRFWIVEDRAKTHTGEVVDTCYQIRPKAYYLLDEINFPSNPNQVLTL